MKKNKSVLQNNNSRPGNWDRKNNQLLIIDHVQGCIREKKRFVIVQRSDIFPAKKEVISNETALASNATIV